MDAVAPKNWSAHPAPTRIISLDGGGVKGYLSAHILHRLAESEAKGEHEHFIAQADMFAGSSAGAILAVALAMGRSTEYILDFAAKKIPEIFQRSFWDNVRNLGTTLGAKYSTDSLRAILNEEFGADLTLKEVPRPVFITTFYTRGRQSAVVPPEDEQEGDWHPRYFSQYHEQDRDELVVDILLRTAAAPTYFPIYQGYVDGGCFANDPAMCVLTSLIRHRGVDIRHVQLISISTGTSWETLGAEHENANWGWAQWIMNERILNVMFKGITSATTSQCRSILGDNFIRIDPQLPSYVKLDDKHCIPLLEEVGMAYDLSAASKWVATHFDSPVVVGKNDPPNPVVPTPPAPAPTNSKDHTKGGDEQAGWCTIQ